MKRKSPKLLVLTTDCKTKKLKPIRLRVSTACLICRRKKRKCDGHLPCNQCEQHSLECEYPKESALKSNPDSIGMAADEVDINDSNTFLENNNEVYDDNLPILDEDVDVKYEDMNSKIGNSSDTDNNCEITITNTNDVIDYKKIVEAIFAEENLKKIRQSNICNEGNNNNNNNINEFLLTLINRNITKDDKLNLREIRMENPTLLPPRDIALQMILKTWNNACVLFRFYHRPTIIKILDLLYQNNGYSHTLNEFRAEALIYAVLAVGALFSKDDNHEDDPVKKEYYKDEGLNYFMRAKSLIDFSDVSDIYSIQTLFMLTLFLQCSANLKSCYHYIGIALRSAIKEGLYKKSSLIGPTPIEDETKKRLFWSIYKVDVYMNCILGLPPSISEDKIDQELPLDIDDEKITSKGIILNSNHGDSPMSSISSCGVNNEHTKLILVMSHIYEYTSQLTLSKILNKDALERIITSLENELSSWKLNLPLPLKPNYGSLNECNSGIDNIDNNNENNSNDNNSNKRNDDRDHYLKSRKLLNLDFLLTKLTLYKPFFHFITLNVNEYPNLEFQIRMSQNCINISIEIIRLSYEMINENLLNGTYWYSIHAIYYSFACLTIYKYQLMEKTSMGDNEYKTLEEIKSVYEIGYKILIELQSFSKAGQRILKVLELIFKQFNEKFLELNKQLISNLRNFKHMEMLSTSVPGSTSSRGTSDNHGNYDNLGGTQNFGRSFKNNNLASSNNNKENSNNDMETGRLVHDEYMPQYEGEHDDVTHFLGDEVNIDSITQYPDSELILHSQKFLNELLEEIENEMCSEK